ncbi:MAG: hypothetical protein ACI9TV_002016 [Sulfurimonas sp.]|jgi:hypothetical protein
MPLLMLILKIKVNIIILKKDTFSVFADINEKYCEIEEIMKFSRSIIIIRRGWIIASL